jgi:hypothetical protein
MSEEYSYCYYVRIKEAILKTQYLAVIYKKDKKNTQQCEEYQK